MFRSMLAIAVGAMLLSAVPAGAQTRGGSAQPPAVPPATEKPAPTAAPPARPEGLLQNIRVDITITDQRGGTAPIKKTISVVAADGLLNRVRFTSQFTPPAGEVPLNVDVVPGVRANGKIRLSLTLQYDLPAPPLADATKGPFLTRTAIQETLNTILEDGKPLVIAQSADPVSDRQVTIEVKATVLK